MPKYLSTAAVTTAFVAARPTSPADPGTLLAVCFSQFQTFVPGPLVVDEYLGNGVGKPAKVFFTDADLAQLREEAVEVTL